MKSNQSQYIEFTSQKRVQPHTIPLSKIMTDQEKNCKYWKLLNQIENVRQIFRESPRVASGRNQNLNDKTLSVKNKQTNKQTKVNKTTQRQEEKRTLFIQTKSVSCTKYISFKMTQS